MADAPFKSKAFRDGGMVRLMDFAVRGMPRSFLPGQAPVDVEWARGVYDAEIRRLDDLDLHSRWFWSGIIGAALISLALWPQTIELWRRLAEKFVFRDEQGLDGPCLLYELIERHQDDARLTRRPDFQLYVFQSAMAVAEAWAFGDPNTQRLACLPPVPDVPTLIEHVRKHKGEPHRIDGFRPPGNLTRHWFCPTAPALSHGADIEVAVALATEASALEPKPPSKARLENAAAWLFDGNPDPTLSHPAALAAALVTVALDECTRELWQQVLTGRGRRQPNPGHKPLVDAAMRIHDCITVANRSARPAEDALRLYFRCRQCVKGWQADPARLWAGLPRIPESTFAASPLWNGSRVPFAPVLSFGRDRPLPSLKTLSEDGEDG